MSYIEVKNLYKSFGQTKVLEDISLTIEKGEFVTFLGSSGCGKTTLLRSLIGLEHPDQGKIFLEGQDITEVPAGRRQMVMIFQQYCLFPTMNVYKNVSFALRMKGLPKEEIQKRVQEVLALVDLTGQEKKFPHQLSGGQQQRVSLARGLITNPKVLLLDEPFSAVDAKLRKELQTRLKEIHQELGMTTVFVTHDQEEAMRMSDTIHLFKDGKIEQSASAAYLYTHPQSDYVAGFIGNYNHFSGEVFSRLTGESTKHEETAVIRPEVIRILKEAEEDSEGYQMRGRIQKLVPLGNITRYVVETAEKNVYVDELFYDSYRWEKGEPVTLQIERDKVIWFEIPKYGC